MADLTPEERQAVFANTFKNTTNLAQRRRYQEQIDQYQSDQKQAAQNQYERALGSAELADPLKAEGLRLNQQKEARLQREGLNREDRLFQQDLRAQQQFEIQKKKFELDERLRNDMHEKALRELDDAERVRADTKKLEDADYELRKRGFFPKSEPYAAAMASAFAGAPYARPDFRKQLAAQANIEGDLEELIAQYPGGNPKVSGTLGPDGRKTWRVSPPEAEMTPEKERLTLEKDVERLQNSLLSSKGTPMEKYYSSRIQETNAKLLGLSQQQGGQATPTPTTPAALDPARLEALKKLIQQ